MACPLEKSILRSQYRRTFFYSIQFSTIAYKLFKSLVWWARIQLKTMLVNRATPLCVIKLNNGCAIRSGDYKWLLVDDSIFNFVFKTLPLY